MPRSARGGPSSQRQVEEVRTAALRLGLDGVKAAAYAVIELLLPQRAYLRRETVKAPVDDVHSVTPLLIM